MQTKIDFSETQFVDPLESTNGNQNKVRPGDSAVHNWYRFVLSFPPHLVRHYIQKFDLKETSVVLDPFCGTGTTIVESKLNGFPAVGIEANPFAYFASSVKTNWNINADDFESAARAVASETFEILKAEGIDDNNFSKNIDESPACAGRRLKNIGEHSQKLLITNSISPLPLHKTLSLLTVLKSLEGESYFHHAMLALANALVFKISNLKFGPEVGVGKPKPDYPVIPAWLNEIKRIAKDIRALAASSYPQCAIKLGDSRQISQLLDHDSVDAVITSPPYPNEKDYTRTTRLESVVLGFINSLEELRTFKKSLIRSNTRGIYKGDADHKWIENNNKVIRLAEEIERKRIELSKTSGFEKFYSKVTLQYFGGMARHFAELRPVLKKGARLAYVVGDQASYFKVMIRTGELLADIAQSLGYELEGIDLFRRRFATATSSELREEVVMLRWPG